MRQKNWLGMLHMRHARHWDFDRLFSLNAQRVQNCAKRSLDFTRRVDDEEAEISGDEFVSTATGVELPAKGAELFDESLFDEMVHIFSVCTGFFGPGRVVLSAVFDFVECGKYLFHFRRSEDAYWFKGFSPGAIDGYFVGQQAAVEREGALEC